MRVRVIQHAEFERSGLIAVWAEERGHELAVTSAWNDDFPDSRDADLLVVLGGPMGALDEAGFPWLTTERRFIAETIAEGRPVLGVCLGAQIVATVIGGSVRRNRETEIGWYEVLRTPEAAASALFTSWPASVVVGHWHGDTFELPQGMKPVLSSAACRNQAFVFDERVVGLQFHLEWTTELLVGMVDECGAELAEPSGSVMPAQEMLGGVGEHAAACRRRLFDLLDHLAATVAGSDGASDK